MSGRTLLFNRTRLAALLQQTRLLRIHYTLTMRQRESRTVCSMLEF